MNSVARTIDPELIEEVRSRVTKDAAHPGKVRAFRDNLDPAKHDGGIPDLGSLKVVLGDIGTLKKVHLDG